MCLPLPWGPCLSTQHTCAKQLPYCLTGIFATRPFTCICSLSRQQSHTQLYLTSQWRSVTLVFEPGHKDHIYRQNYRPNGYRPNFYWPKFQRYRPNYKGVGFQRTYDITHFPETQLTTSPREWTQCGTNEVHARDDTDPFCVESPRASDVFGSSPCGTTRQTFYFYRCFT